MKTVILRVSCMCIFLVFFFKVLYLLILDLYFRPDNHCTPQHSGG